MTFEFNEAGKWFIRLDNGRYGSKFYNSYDELLEYYHTHIEAPKPLVDEE